MVAVKCGNCHTVSTLPWGQSSHVQVPSNSTCDFSQGNDSEFSVYIFNIKKMMESALQHNAFTSFLGFQKSALRCVWYGDRALVQESAFWSWLYHNAACDPRQGTYSLLTNFFTWTMINSVFNIWYMVLSPRKFLFFFPASLRYNWLITLFKFKA